MARERIVDFVGASDEEVARLRLMMRKAGKQLVERWRLRQEADEQPDLLLVDPSTVTGSTALARAREGDRPCVILGEAGKGSGANDILPRAFKLDDLVRMFNAAGMAAMTATLPPAAAPTITHNVFDDIFSTSEETTVAVDLGDFNPDEFSFDIPAAATFTRGFEESEALFKHNSDREHREALKQINLGEHIEIEATDGHTDRTAHTGERKSGTIYVSSSAPISPRFEAEAAPAAGDDTERYRLDAYLTRSLLPGPARLVHTSLSALTLDPRSKLFYAKGTLCAFEPHVMRLFPRGAWQALSATEFAEVREQQSGRDYVELIWLSAYLNSGGRLANNMDPSALYRLRKPFNLGRDYPQASKIVGLLQRSSRAADLATATRCELGEVYNVLNAFDAIGYLDRA